MNIYHALTLSLCHLRAGRIQMAERMVGVISDEYHTIPEYKLTYELVSLYKTHIDTINTVHQHPHTIQQILSSLQRINDVIDKTIDTSKVFFATNESCMIPGLGDIYEDTFKRKRTGTFVEVGAFDGRTQSNTDCLPPLGWSGLYIEPVPQYFEQCVRWHGTSLGVRFENCAIGAYEGTTQLVVGGVLSTANPDVAARWLEIAWSSRYFDSSYNITVPIKRLDNVLTDHEIPIEFDVLVVDTEGYEREVFRGFDLAKWKPKLAIIELAEQADQFTPIESMGNYCEEIRANFMAHKYQELYRDDTNTIFRAP